MAKQARQTLQSPVLGFGAAVDLNQDASWVAVGAPHSPRGSVLMHEFYELVWVEKHRMQPADATSRFGESVAVDRRADFVVVGDPGQEAIYIYTKQGTKFALARKIVSPAAGQKTDFGLHVDIAYDAKTIVVGARRQGDAGVVYIYRYEGGDWVDFTVVEPSDLTPGADFGNTVGISNDGRKVIVGAPDTTETEMFNITDDTGPPDPPCPVPPCPPPTPDPIIGITWVFVGAAYLIVLENQSWVVQAKAMNKTRPIPSTLTELNDIPSNMRYDRVRSRLGFGVCISGDGGRVALGCAGNDIFGLYSHQTRNLGVNTWENPRMSFRAHRVAMPNNGLEIVAARPGDARTFIYSPGLGSWFTFYTLQPPPGVLVFGKDVTFSGDATVRFAGSS